MLKINPSYNLDHCRDVEKFLASDPSKEQRDTALAEKEATITHSPTAEKLESTEKVAKVSNSSLIEPSSQKLVINNAQKIRNCWNYIFEHAKSIFLAGAAVCATMAIKTHLTPHGDTQDNYKAVLKTAPQVFLGLSTIFASLAATSGRNLSKASRTLILLPSILGTAAFLPGHLSNIIEDREVAIRLKECAAWHVKSGEMKIGERLRACTSRACELTWEDRGECRGLIGNPKLFPDRLPAGHRWLMDDKRIIGLVKLAKPVKS